ncbi:hypothetical protein SNEBB_001728 [Seison nebaliae]|nr:hypothetical protein SNEBB_001728 [Seison nebaliae]
MGNASSREVVMKNPNEPDEPDIIISEEVKNWLEKDNEPKISQKLDTEAALMYREKLDSIVKRQNDSMRLNADGFNDAVTEIKRMFPRLKDEPNYRCLSEREMVMDCLKVKKDKPLQCLDYTNAFYDCVYSS